jgi:hypothetical protein
MGHLLLFRARFSAGAVLAARQLLLSPVGCRPSDNRNSNLFRIT